MRFGISLTGMGQQPSGFDMRQTFEDILEYVRAARDLGFDFIYQGQHYLTYPYQQLQSMPLLARLAAETGTMDIVGTLLIPLHHPVDLAERIATMDVITNGRFVLAAALGYREEEYGAFGIDSRRRVSRYTECLEIMKKLWVEDEVTFLGEHFQLHKARAVMKPIQRPYPQIWVAANSDSAIERAARKGYLWYVNPHATYNTICRQISLYHESFSKFQSSVLNKLPIGRELFVQRDRKKAFADAEPYLGGKYKAYAQWGQDKALPDDESFAKSFKELAQDRFIVGTPEDCVLELRKYNALGISHCCLRMMWPGMSLNQGMQNMELFAREVMPYLKN
ncbi:LLM class flavin-dependent oxidoreductase [SAR202 cluster bacterium AD-802-E10_MRT_200m]|nr:LLM class flavin-dependent oxidoreductase [SAR202 cluster bacterium AD-802-E10_MRT_200m]